MSERQKLPRYIVVLNIIMIVLLLAICALVFALTMSSKDLGWELPTAGDQSASASQSAGEAPSDSLSEITAQASSAE